MVLEEYLPLVGGSQRDMEIRGEMRIVAEFDMDDDLHSTGDEMHRHWF
jgi:hypothetical protein